MISPAQLRAARALLGIDQRTLAEMAGVSLPTIQRMEASTGNVRGVIDTLTKVVRGDRIRRRRTDRQRTTEPGPRARRATERAP
jgi:predicted transcriptional regulator